MIIEESKEDIQSSTVKNDTELAVLKPKCLVVNDESVQLMVLYYLFTQ